MQKLPPTGLFILLWISACQTVSDGTQVAPEVFKATMSSDTTVQLIDVRTLQEFETGHISGALHWDIENGDFKRKLPTLDKNKQVLVYCAVGGRSAKAAQQLKDAGFLQVLDLKGGIKAWKASGLPTE